MRYRKVEHIGIAVDDVDRMIDLLCNKIGLRCDRVVEYPAFNVRVAFIPVGETLIELVQGTSPDNEISRYVAERGNGIHHICIEVEGLDGTLDELDANGVKLADRVPRRLDESTRFAFLDPEAADGIRLELYEKS